MIFSKNVPKVVSRYRDLKFALCARIVVVLWECGGVLTLTHNVMILFLRVVLGSKAFARPSGCATIGYLIFNDRVSYIKLIHYLTKDYFSYTKP